METLQGEDWKEFVKFSSVACEAFIAKTCSNSHGCFVALAEHSGGGWRAFIIIQNGQERKG